MPANVNFDLKAAQAAAAGAAPRRRGTRHDEGAEGRIRKSKQGSRSSDRQEQGIERRLSRPAGTALDAKMYDAAIEGFNKAAMLDDKQVAVWSGLADAYVGAAGQKTGGSLRAL